MKTSPFKFSFSQDTTASVNCSQPLSLWEVAWCARTVRTALSRSTPARKGDSRTLTQAQRKHRTAYPVLISHPVCLLIKSLECVWFFLMLFSREQVNGRYQEWSSNNSFVEERKQQAVKKLIKKNMHLI